MYSTDEMFIDWGKFKSKTKGKMLEKAKKGYVDLCKILYENNHKLISDYLTATTNIVVDFNCEHEPSSIAPFNYKNSRVCPKCSKLTSFKRAKEDFINTIADNNHIALSEYRGTEIKVLIDFKCNHDPHWITPHAYKAGQRCPKCSKRGRLYGEESLLETIFNNGHELVSEYINSETKVLIDFKCGHNPHWIDPYHYKNGHGCPKCGTESSSTIKTSKTREHLISILSKNNHRLLSKYINNSTKVLIDFNCGHNPHWITPNDYKSGKGCPLCKNKGEAALYGLLLDMGYEVHKQKKYEDLKDKDYLKYDFYLPEYNLLIELDGEHHRESKYYRSTKNMTNEEIEIVKTEALLKLQDRQRKDRLKDDYAKNNNINLLRIEYNNSKIELKKWKKLISNKVRNL